MSDKPEPWDYSPEAHQRRLLENLAKVWGVPIEEAKKRGLKGFGINIEIGDTKISAGDAALTPKDDDK